MSGDVQPRKRKDKKKKKDEAIPQPKEEPTITSVPVITGPLDELIHVHKESRLGGNICAKIVFFILLGTIAVAVGFIITEYKGSGDVASPIDSPWSKALDGWVDDGTGDKHDDDHDIHPIASEEEHDDEDDDHIPSHGSEEMGSHEEEDEIVPKRSSLTESQVSGEELDGVSDEHGGGGNQVEEGSHEDDNAEEEDQGFLGMAIQGLFGSASGSPIEGDEESPNSVEIEEQGDEGNKEQSDEDEDQADGGLSNEAEGRSNENEEQSNENDEDNENITEDNDEDTETNADVAESNENLNSDEDQNNKDDNDIENNVNSREEENDERDNEEEEPDKEKEDDDKSEENPDSNENALNAEQDDGDSNEENDSKNKEDDDDVDENNNIENEDVSEEDTQFYARGSLEEDDGNTGDQDDDDDGDDFVEERDVPDLGDAPFPDAGLDDLAGEPDEFEEIQDQPETGNKRANEDATLDPVGIALKFGVGIAIIIVAHMVLVKKWNQSESGAATLDPTAATDSGECPPLVPRRQTLIPPTAQLDAGPDDEDLEDYDFSNEEDEELQDSPRIVPVGQGYTKLALEDSEEEAEEDDEGEVEEEEAPEDEFDKMYGYSYKSAPPQSKQQQEVPESDEAEDEELLEEEELGEEEVEEEEEDDDEEDHDGSSWPRDRGDQRSEDEPSEGEVSEDEPAAGKPRAPAPRSGGQQEIEEYFDAMHKLEAPPPAVQRTEEERVLEEARLQMDEVRKILRRLRESVPEEQNNNIFGGLALEDKKYRTRREMLDDVASKGNPESTLKLLDTFISSSQKKRPSAQVAVLRARTLDNLAQKKRSNKLLEQVINSYIDLLNHSGLDDNEFSKIADRCIDRIRFRGHHHKAVEIHQKVIEKFPNDPSPKNQLAVTYLMTNSVTKAKKVLEEVLARWPKNGFALVHYGFILKTSENNVSEGVRHLQAGIDSKEPGTMDARFLFHLGDGLNRLGRPDQAMKVYELGVEAGLFRSKYQRSLYNVDRLTAKPWWTIKETTYEDLFRKLEQNWEAIRDEGLSALSSTGSFKDEAENLRDVGDWKQLELYARGRRLSNCARAPITCGLITSFPAARDCRRGQVKFSVMHPGTHVWPHCGPTNCRLRSHLGLVVPAGTAIRVADETRAWEEGKIIVFDDSFEHEVWHNGSSFRLVLIVDIWHPELTELEKRSLPAI